MDTGIQIKNIAVVFFKYHSRQFSGLLYRQIQLDNTHVGSPDHAAIANSVKPGQ